MKNYIMLASFNSETGMLSKVSYTDTRFPREIGDTMEFGGIRMQILAIGEDKQEVIHQGNILVRAQNAILRRKAKVDNIEFRKNFRKRLMADFSTLKSMSPDEVNFAVNQLAGNFA